MPTQTEVQEGPNFCSTDFLKSTSTECLMPLNYWTLYNNFRILTKQSGIYRKESSPYYGDNAA